MPQLFLRLKKMYKVFGDLETLAIFFRYRVVATYEHESILRDLKPNLVVDVGANYGQFSLLCSKIWPQAQIIAFEPIPKCFNKMKQIFTSKSNIIIHNVALGNYNGESSFHISKSIDSSSLLEITELQNSIFRKTYEKKQTIVKVTTLKDALEGVELPSGSILKIDVQGGEFEVLEGAVNTLQTFDYIFVELSFFELYLEQKLAGSTIVFLSSQGFKLIQMGNVYVKKTVGVIQADFLFQRISS